MILIKIIQEQRNYALKIAKQINERFQGKQGRFEGKPSEAAHFLGLLAETVLADYYSKPRPVFYETGGDQFDLEFNGKRFDVKNSTYKGRKKFLRVHERELWKSMNGYILTSIDEGHLWVFGWASKNEVLESKEVQDFGFGKNHCIPLNKLHKMEELK